MGVYVKKLIKFAGDTTKGIIWWTRVWKARNQKNPFEGIELEFPRAPHSFDWNGAVTSENEIESANDKIFRQNLSEQRRPEIHFLPNEKPTLIAQNTLSVSVKSAMDASYGDVGNEYSDSSNREPLTQGIGDNVGPFHEDLDKFNSEQEINQLFHLWKIHFKREYQSPEEEAQRFKIFKGHVKYVKKLNAKAKNPNSYGLNDFSDMTFSEFSDKYLMNCDCDPSPKGCTIC